MSVVRHLRGGLAATTALVTGIAAAGLALAASSVGAPSAAAAPLTQTVRFTHVDRNAITWTVPDGVSHVGVELAGANGGALTTFLGGIGAGRGALVKGGFDVDPNHRQLELWIGEPGASTNFGGIGGWGGRSGLRSGGDGGRGALGDPASIAAGGGGATEIDVDGAPLYVAGGGGGAPSNSPDASCEVAAGGGIGGCGALGLGQGAPGFPVGVGGGGGAGQTGGQPGNLYGCSGIPSALCGQAGGAGQGGVGGHLTSSSGAGGGGGGGWGGGAGGSGGVGGGGAGGSWQPLAVGNSYGMATPTSGAYVSFTFSIDRPADRCRLVPVTPARVLDTREATGPTAGQRVGPARAVDLAIAGHGGVPAAGASAVVLNLTATDTTGPGFVTAFPAGTARPTASNLNVTGAGQTVANLVIVPLGPGGAVSLFSLGGAHLVADVEGYCAPAATAPDGRFLPSTNGPHRILDTRGAIGVTGTDPVPAGGVVELTVTALNSNVEAVVLNVTATATSAPGFVTVWPAGEARPNASSLNITGAGQTVANLVLVPVGAGRKVDLFASAGTHLVVDQAGVLTSASAPDVAAGLFVPLAPARVLDTRAGLGRAGTAALAADETIDVAATGVGGVPTPNVSAVVWNVTAVDTAAAGFVTLWPSGVVRPTASNVNVTSAGQVVANLAIGGVGANGAESLYTKGATHLLADVAGYFLAS